MISRDFYDNLENVRLERLHRLFDNLVDLPRLTRWASSHQRRRLCRVFASENWLKSVAASKRMNTRSERFCKICWKARPICWRMLWLLAEWTQCSTGKNTYRNRIAGWSTISQPVGIPFILNLVQWSISNEEIANHRADERYEIIQILEELSDSLRPHAAEIANNAWIIGHLDLIKAKYRFMRDFKAVVPEVSSNRSYSALATTVIPWLKMPSRMTCILPRTWLKSWLLVPIQVVKPSC